MTGKIESEGQLPRPKTAPPIITEPGVAPESGFAPPGAMPDSTPGNVAEVQPGTAHFGLP